MLRDLQSTSKYHVKNNDTDSINKSSLSQARDKAKEYGMRMTKKNKLLFDTIKEQKLKQADGSHDDTETNQHPIDIIKENQTKTVNTRSYKLDPTIMRGKFDFDHKSREKSVNNDKKSTNCYTNIFKSEQPINNQSR